MIGIAFQSQNKMHRVKKAADKASYRNFGHAGAGIRKIASSSIKSSPDASAAGSPPNTRKRNFIRRAIRFAVFEDGTGAVIGTMASMIGDAGGAHEQGGEYRGEEYPKREFMGPALDQGAPRLADNWRGTIGE